MKFKKSMLTLTFFASAITSGAGYSNVTPELYFVNPMAAAERVSYEDSAAGNDRTRINDIHLYDNKLFTVYGSWDNDNPGYVHICHFDVSQNDTNCEYRFGSHGISKIHEINDKLYFMASDPAEHNAVFPYQGLAIYDKDNGWKSVSAYNFKDVDGSYIWYAHGGAIQGQGNTLYSLFTSGNGYTTKNKIFKSTDGGINWRAEPLTHQGNMVSHQGKLYSLDRYGAVFDDEKYSYGPRFDEVKRANNTYYVADDSGWMKNENAPLIFPEYNEFYDFDNGHWVLFNAVSFKEKVVLTMRNRRYLMTSSGRKRWFTEQALSVTDLKNNATKDNIIYRTELYNYCQGVAISLRYTCRDYLLQDVHTTDNWLYVLLKTGEIRRTSDLKNWEIVTQENSFPEGVLTLSMTADDDYAYVGANKGQVYRVKLPETTSDDNQDDAPQGPLTHVNLIPLHGESSQFYSWAGGLDGTLSDRFTYDPENPINAKPEQMFNYYTGNGAYGFLPEGQDLIMTYGMHYIHQGGRFVVDLYGRTDYGQDRDDNVSVIVFDANGSEISRLINLKIDEDGHVRAEFDGIEQYTVISKLVVRMHDTAFTFGNFPALMEIRAAGHNL